MAVNSSTTPVKDSNKRRGSLEVYNLGVVDLGSLQILQNQMLLDLTERVDDQAILLLCEHPPCISWGRDSHQTSMVYPQSELKKHEIQSHWVKRGGGCIPHVPGQLGISLLAPIKKLSLFPLDFIRNMIRWMKDALQAVKIKTDFMPEKFGLFTPGGQIAYAGAAVRNGVTLGGGYINVNPWLEFFHLLSRIENHWENQSDNPQDRKYVSPCVTSIHKECMKPIKPAKIREFLITKISKELGYDKVHLYSRHPFLERTSRKLLVNV